MHLSQARPAFRCATSALCPSADPPTRPRHPRNAVSVVWQLAAPRKTHAQPADTTGVRRGGHPQQFVGKVLRVDVVGCAAALSAGRAEGGTTRGPHRVLCAATRGGSRCEKWSLLVRLAQGGEGITCYRVAAIALRTGERRATCFSIGCKDMCCPLVSAAGGFSGLGMFCASVTAERRAA